MFAIVLGASGVQVAHAASLIVNMTDDNITSGDGFCTLREAITNANWDSDTTSGDCAAGSGNDSISFSVSGTITLTSILPIISDLAGLTIDGAGQNITISGNDSVQVMIVNSGAVLIVQNLTIAHGYVVGHGGGIRNGGTLTVTNSTFSGNRAIERGGGIENFGTLTVMKSTFSGNSVEYEGGGGIDNYLGSTLTVTSSIFSGNSAKGPERGFGVGGGIANGSDGMLTVTNSIFTGNTATENGGGISNGGTLDVANSTFSGNRNVSMI